MTAEHALSIAREGSKRKGDLPVMGLFFNKKYHFGHGPLLARLVLMPAQPETTIGGNHGRAPVHFGVTPPTTSVISGSLHGLQYASPALIMKKP